MQYTSNLNLKKPEGTDVVDIQDLNSNMDTLDIEVAKKVDKVTGKQLSTEDYTTAEKTKLAGIAAGANNYVHPSTHPAGMITEDSTHRFVTDTEKSTWNAKETTTGAQAKVDTHANLTNTHGATSTSTANRIMMRDASGRAKVAAPSATDDIARKAEVDTVQTNLNTHTNNVSNPHSVTKSQVGLGSVENYGIATQAESEAGTVTNKYMTPQRTKQAIAAQVGSVLFRINNGELEFYDGGWKSVGIQPTKPRSAFLTVTSTNSTHEVVNVSGTGRLGRITFNWNTASDPIDAMVITIDGVATVIYFNQTYRDTSAIPYNRQQIVFEHGAYFKSSLKVDLLTGGIVLTRAINVDYSLV